MKSVLLLSFNFVLLVLLSSIIGCGVKKPPVAKGVTPMAYEQYIKKSKRNKEKN